MGEPIVEEEQRVVRQLEHHPSVQVRGSDDGAVSGIGAEQQTGPEPAARVTGRSSGSRGAQGKAEPPEAGARALDQEEGLSFSSRCPAHSLGRQRGEVL